MTSKNGSNIIWGLLHGMILTTDARRLVSSHTQREISPNGMESCKRVTRAMSNNLRKRICDGIWKFNVWGSFRKFNVWGSVRYGLKSYNINCLTKSCYHSTYVQCLLGKNILRDLTQFVMVYDTDRLIK